MLTRPESDPHCLTLALGLAQERAEDPAIQAIAREFENTGELADSYRARPQLDDAPWVLPKAPRLPCHPPMRVRFNAKNPHCGERSVDYVTLAEIIDPDTPRTLMTVRLNGQLHVLPVEYTDDGPVPIILDPLDRTRNAMMNDNLSYAAVAHQFGYGSGQVSPTSDPRAWAETLAARDGLEMRNGADLLSVAERYADAYPGGRQGLADLAEQFGETVKDAAKTAAKAGAQAGKAGVKAGKKVAEEVADEYRKRPGLGQLLRAAVVGYGGPLAVLAIDVVENRLNKRGYTLGSMAESHDTDVFAFQVGGFDRTCPERTDQPRKRPWSR